MARIIKDIGAVGIRLETVDTHDMTYFIFSLVATMIELHLVPRTARISS